MKELDSFPKVSLGIFPTPVHKLENISRKLNVSQRNGVLTARRASTSAKPRCDRPRTITS